MTTMPRRSGAVLLLAVAAMLGGCATTQRPDPLEPMNRKVFAFNEGVDKYALEPVARTYRDVTPQIVRTGVSNFFNNFRDAWSGVNLLLQGRVEDGVSDFMRFGINTTMGFVGLLDWAGEMGLEPHYEDFGQTLGKWGVQPGAYLVWPILGPSTVRDSANIPVETLWSPTYYVDGDVWVATMTGLRVVNTRASLLDATRMLDDIALDKYIFVRDAYLQRRRSLVYDGNPPEEPEETQPLADEPPAPRP